MTIEYDDAGIMILPTDYHDLDGRAGERRIVREEYIKRQGNKCYWCKGPLNADPPKTITSKRIDWTLFPPGFLDYPVHLQHCHDTGMTEGAVHAYCNAMMWQYHGR